MKKAFIISIIIILLLGTFVLAAGSSTNTRKNSTNTNSTVNCEDKTNLEDRIRCRMQYPDKAKAYGIEEACRGHNKTDACSRLYERSARCYNETLTNGSIMKKKCFLNESGININRGGTFRAAPKEAKQNYVVLLLYELQERIERMQESGLITADEASSLIAKIVEIKRMILAEEPRSDIIIKINEFKREYRSVVLGKSRGGNNNSTNSTINVTVGNGTVINNTI